MNVTITARKTTIKDSFRERVEKKLSKLDRFFDENASAAVTVTNERDRETVEVTVSCHGMYYRAEKTTDDRFDSLEAVVDSLVKQIVKNKTKLAARLKKSAFEIKDEFDDLPMLADNTYQVAKVKHFSVKPMDVEEAILQMNLLGHEFYMFKNQDTGDINVVYKRKNGDYGLIEPETV
ncbi:MAG TPA: ribosome-associated translation inhibitor RaiA [Ruminococcaceae bacterium]|nr:ribosome-associated translation inhibitor RaiA [Oscillospiraceae bacterium]